jgi:hypothetical protein
MDANTGFKTFQQATFSAAAFSAAAAIIIINKSELSAQEQQSQ